MSYLLIFCIVSLLILLHKLGHFLAAKRMGIPIARFSVGLGPKVWGFKMGETEYWLSMIPCGGYVMPALKDGEAFDKVPLKSRILFALGGGWRTVVIQVADSDRRRTAVQSIARSAHRSAGRDRET